MELATARNFGIKRKKKTLPKTLVVSVCANLIGSINLILKLCHLLC